jgi:hypothetical protein
MQGWKRYASDPDPRVRERFPWEIRSIKTVYSGLSNFKHSHEPKTFIEHRNWTAQTDQ